jgi:hypothetical protein
LIYIRLDAKASGNRINAMAGLIQRRDPAAKIKGHTLWVFGGQVFGGQYTELMIVAWLLAILQLKLGAA